MLELKIFFFVQLFCQDDLSLDSTFEVQIVSYTLLHIHCFVYTLLQLKITLRTMYLSEGFHTYKALIRPFDMEQLLIYM